MSDSRWTEAVRDYYEEKNRIWFCGRAALGRATAARPGASRGLREALLWHQRLPSRRRTALLSHTRVDTRRVTRVFRTDRENVNEAGLRRSEESGTTKLLVDVSEHVRLLYRIGNDVGEERRIYPWRLTIVSTDLGWKVAEERALNDAERAGWAIPSGEPPDRVPGLSPGRWRERWRKLFTFRRFDRLQAFKYAELWWDGYNPRFRAFRVDCTNFVSQCLWHGGLPMEPAEQPGRGWWYAWRDGGDRWSLSWAVSHSFHWYMMQKAREGKVRFLDRPQRLYVGDVILYDWNGDGAWQHAAVVVDFDPDGQPLVNAHTVASYHRLWDYTDSPAWSERTRYAFVHIEDP
ncbi:MAG: amidase domain-containing protein [Kyrpidia sp.]|nr:amidase domain-containing protein [Kyrpidia sp.]